MASFDLFDPEQTPRGVSTHFKTPFLENGRLDEASFERAARHAVDVGSCLAITGQRGCETLDLSEAERYRSLEISIETCRGRTPVLATAAAATVADTVETAKRMEDMGADMISALAPASTHGGGHILMCLRAVAEAVSVPIMLRTFDWGHHLNMEQSAQLARAVPNVRYMKQEGLYPTREVAELMGLPGGDLYMGVIVGPPYVPNYLAGARILTAALDVTEPLVAIFDAMEAGDLDRARAISRDVDSLQFFKGYFRGQIDNKMIMQRRGLIDSHRVATEFSPGLKDLTPDEEDELTARLEPLMPFFEKYPPSPPA